MYSEEQLYSPSFTSSDTPSVTTQQIACVTKLFHVKEFNIYQDVLKSELEMERRLDKNAFYLRLRSIPAVCGISSV